MNKYTAALVHLVLFVLIAAVGAYWAVRIMTPQPIAAPPPLAAPPPRDPDPVAAARMFGLIQMAAAAVSNVQVAGLFAAGKDSSAVLTVDGKPPRAYVLGQEVTSGTTLVEVRPDGVTLERAGGRQEVRAPSRAASVPLSANGPPASTSAYQRQGNTLTVNGAGAGVSRSVVPVQPQARPQALVPPPQEPPSPPNQAQPGVVAPE